eukprot:6537177-Prymnesium_polylepis.1
MRSGAHHRFVLDTKPTIATLHHAGSEACRKSCAHGAHAQERVKVWEDNNAVISQHHPVGNGLWDVLPWAFANKECHVCDGRTLELSHRGSWAVGMRSATSVWVAGIRGIGVFSLATAHLKAVDPVRICSTFHLVGQLVAREDTMASVHNCYAAIRAAVLVLPAWPPLYGVLDELRFAGNWWQFAAGRVTAQPGCIRTLVLQRQEHHHRNICAHVGQRQILHLRPQLQPAQLATDCDRNTCGCIFEARRRTRSVQKRRHSVLSCSQTLARAPTGAHAH